MSSNSRNISDSETKFRSIQRSESTDNTCPVCHETIEIYAIGSCDHRVCYRCSTRMRVLCETLDCPICRSVMPQVAFVRSKLQFKDVSLRDCIPNRKYKIFFQDEDVEDMYLDLLEFMCRICRNRKPDRTFIQLQTHMRKEHQLFACDLCVSHLKIFPFERKFYTRKNLALHRRVGDPDDKSYKGHPLCEFCDTRYNDKDELLKHLRKDHYFCHFCDQQGSNAYYDQYVDLMKHFSELHYLCTEGECASHHTRFTHAFNSEIDLKAHKASDHNKNMSKAQSREARTIEVDFQLPPRRQGNGRGVNGYDGGEDTRGGGRGRGGDRYHRRRERNDEDLQRALEASMVPAEVRPPVEERVPDPIHDFPSLGGAPAVMNTFTPSYMATNRGAPAVEDFPTLSAASAKSSKPIPPPSKAYSSVMSFSNDPQPVSVPVTKESKPVSLGTVSAKSKERWSAQAPKKTLEDYPTLGSLSTAASSASWVRSSQPSVASVPSRPAQISRPFPASATVKNISDEKEFPTLGGGASRQRDNVFKNPFGPDWSNPQSSKKKPAVVSRKDKVDDSFELPDSYYKTYEPSKLENSTQETLSCVDNNNKVNSSDRQVPDSSDFPTLPQRTQNQKESKGGGDKKKKKNKKLEDKSESNQKNKKVSNPNASLNDIAQGLVKNGPSAMKNGVTVKTNPASKPKKTDWFDNPPVEPVPEKEEELSVNNFPSLHAMPVSVQQPKPPPGFKPDPPPPPASSVISPPGFHSQQLVTKESTQSTPPGFSRPYCNNNNRFIHSQYTQPPDFKSRNLQLIQDIRNALEDVDEGFPNFRALSGQFRQGNMEVSDYFYSCQALMGEVNFARIFPELLGLLPDIVKQRELFEIFQVMVEKSLQAGTAPDGSHWQGSQVLEACPACGQVVLQQDKQHHALAHRMEGEDFPSLGDLSLEPVALPTPSLKEAWIKAK